MKCVRCEKELPKLRDVYGNAGEEMCWTCWSTIKGRPNSHYGLFPGGDPRNFTPDFEVCDKVAIQRWRDDCADWNDNNFVYVPVHSYGPGVINEE